MSVYSKFLFPLALVAVISACAKLGGNAEPSSTGPASGGGNGGAAANAAAAPIKLASGTYTLDPAHTDILAQWFHFGFSNPTANFGDVTGTLVYDDADVSKSSVQVTIPLSGITANGKFDEYLRDVDFFDAAKYPTITFKSTKVERAGVNRLTVSGNLTVKGITKPVTLNVTINGSGEHPMTHLMSAGFDATGTLNRSEFGINGYLPLVSDEIRLRITTEGSIPNPAG